MTRILVLLGVWLALFRAVTPGLLLGGVVVAVLADRLVPSPRVPGIRWWQLPRFVAVESVAVARSAWAVARTVLTPGGAPTPIGLAFRLPGADLRELGWVAAAMTMSPGTYVIDVDPERHVLRLHLLDATRAAATAEDLRRIHRAVRRVLGVADDSTIELDVRPQPVAGLADHGSPL